MKYLCYLSGVQVVYLPRRSPRYGHAAAQSSSSRDLPPKATPTPHTCRFNPIEKFNGWLKDWVREAIAMGSAGACRERPLATVYSTVDAYAAVLPDLCKGWIHFLFAH